MEKLPPWTASSLDAYLTCPQRYYRTKIAKDVKDLPPSDAVLLGRKLHKAFENAVNLGDGLPAEYRHLQPLLDKIKALPGEKLPEHKFGCTEGFQPCNFFDKQVWTRGAADLVVKHGKTCLILDYKTGKRKPSDQLKLYAAYAFSTWPEIETVHTMFVWLKEKKIDKATYKREDVSNIWNDFIPIVARVRKSFETNNWPEKPSGLCRAWCPCTGCRYWAQ